MSRTNMSHKQVEYNMILAKARGWFGDLQEGQ